VPIPRLESYQNVQKYIHSLRSQILNRKRPECLIRYIYLFIYYDPLHLHKTSLIQLQCFISYRYQTES